MLYFSFATSCSEKSSSVTITLISLTLFSSLWSLIMFIVSFESREDFELNRLKSLDIPISIFIFSILWSLTSLDLFSESSFQYISFSLLISFRTYKTSQFQITISLVSLRLEVSISLKWDFFSFSFNCFDSLLFHLIRTKILSISLSNFL